MAGLILVGTLPGGPGSSTANILDLDLEVTPSGMVLVGAGGMGSGVTTWRLADAASLGQRVSYTPHLPAMGGLGQPRLLMLDENGQHNAYTLGLSNGATRAVRFDDAGRTVGSDSIGLPADTLAAEGFMIGGTQYLLSARGGSGGIQTWRTAADGSAVLLSAATIPGARPAARINDLEVASVGGAQFAISASSTGDFIASHRIGADGRLGVGSVVGVSWRAPFMAPREIEVVTSGGNSFVVVAGGTSNSLSVMRLGADGALTPVDHILDELTTRFSRVTAMETVTLNGRGYVFAAGADDGISMFAVLPDGRLIHVATLADTPTMPLADITALAAAVSGGRITLCAASATDRGVVQFQVDPGAIGFTGYAATGTARGTAADDIMIARAGTAIIDGGAGDDTLVSGTRPVILTGGKGADVFMPTALIGRITITDFEVGKDRLDLSDLGMIRSAAQLTMQPVTGGLLITFGATVVELRTTSGRSDMRLISDANFPIAHYPTPGNLLTLVGTPAADVLSAGVNVLYAYGLAGNDLLEGGILNDQLSGGDGNDRLFGRSGQDWLAGGTGDDSLYGDSGHDTLLGQEGNDRLIGGAGDDRVVGGMGNDFLTGDDGLDVLLGEDGADRLAGGTGNDTLDGGSGNDTLDGGAGNDLVTDALGNNLLGGGDGEDTLLGGAGRDTIQGGNGADMVIGRADSDLLQGGTGNDTLLGGLGGDSIAGDQGDDRLAGDEDNDRLDGGDGHDTLFGGAGHDWLNGGLGNDRLYGMTGNDLMLGGTGRDSLNGGDGSDTLSGGAEADTLEGDIGADSLLGGSDSDRLWGGTGRDTLHGEDGDDLCWGGPDADWITGGAGQDRLAGGTGADTILGGSGQDWISGEDGRDSLEGQDGNDTLDGGGDADILRGGAGHDSLFGQGGNDSMEGGDGDDVLWGGFGNDILRGGAGSDTLYGGTGADHLHGGFGNDLLYGGDGNDRIEGAYGSNRMFGGLGLDTIIGGAFDDTLAGEADADWLQGDGGNDRLDGGGGNDTMTAGNGNDWLSGGDGNDRLSGDDGNDILIGGSGNDTLSGGAGNDTLTGGAGQDRLTGGGGADVFVFKLGDSLPAAPNMITDFNRAFDLIDMRGLGLHFTAGGLMGSARQITAVNTPDGGIALLIDMNGNKMADLSIQLPGITTLTADDFLL